MSIIVTPRHCRHLVILCRYRAIQCCLCPSLDAVRGEARAHVSGAVWRVAAGDNSSTTAATTAPPHCWWPPPLLALAATTRIIPSQWQSVLLLLLLLLMHCCCSIICHGRDAIKSSNGVVTFLLSVQCGRHENKISTIFPTFSSRSAVRRQLVSSVQWRFCSKIIRPSAVGPIKSIKYAATYDWQRQTHKGMTYTIYVGLPPPDKNQFDKQWLKVCIKCPKLK